MVVVLLIPLIMNPESSLFRSSSVPSPSIGPDVVAGLLEGGEEGLLVSVVWGVVDVVAFGFVFGFVSRKILILVLLLLLVSFGNAR